LMLGGNLTGELRREILPTVLDALPVEMSFVDENDTVRYFNKNGNRIFPRPPAVIGRKVQDCHPKKSLHKVEQILDDFKNNRRDSAEFWIDLKNMLSKRPKLTLEAQSRTPDHLIAHVSAPVRRLMSC